MKKYEFGLKAEEYTQNDSCDFATYAPKNDTENPNPYGGTFFAEVTNMPRANKEAERRITSVPSPYARMHLTDLAFEELATHKLNITDISNDYIKAMSHCLDMFELFFRFDQLDLLEKGITIERVELISKKLGDTTKWKKFLDQKPNKNVSNYIETLDLFRLQYLEVIKKANTPNFKFGFTDLYVFKGPKGRIFGSTSPFTGFFTSATCNLGDLDISVSDGEYSHKFLTTNPLDWKMLEQRSKEFQDFMFVLLNPEQKHGGLGNVFHNLFKVVELTISNRKTELQSRNFSEQYPQFNFTQEPLPRIKTPDNSKYYLRSSDMDRSYLKYLLFFNQEEPINFAIDKSLYNIPVAERKFPDGSDSKIPWFGVNDLLSDALFVLPYDISDDYVGVDYVDDESNLKHRRCLLPIRADKLWLFPDLLKNANERISIRRYKDGHYTVSLKVDILTDTEEYTTMDIRREYRPKSYDYQYAIKGRVYDACELDNFAFGIYPFVKSVNEINIYKVLFYNQLKGKLSDKTLSLNFYREDVNAVGKYVPYMFDENSRSVMNYTSEYDERSQTINNIYYHIEHEAAGQGIDFVELSIMDEESTKDSNVRMKGTALIAPLLPTKSSAVVGGTADSTLVAIDLGTSNTYIAYQHASEEISEIDMVHDGKAELRFMQKAVQTPFNLDDRYSQDLCIQPSEQSCMGKEKEQQRSLWLKNVPTQLCEFIPTRIRKNEPQNLNNSFSFPIPTLISPLKLKGSNDINGLDIRQNKPLVHSTIPFAYYEVGKRSYDAPRGDFKWFVDLNQGMINDSNKEALTLFVSELLFIVRSHMLYKGYDLQKCKIIWTYPLAFNETLKGLTEAVWQEQYLRYFRNDAQQLLAQPQAYDGINDFVKSTNESLSPFYYCMAMHTAPHAYQLLIDIGGGSSDVMGFEAGTPQFISSFNFAGNDLYLYKSHTKANIVRKCINTLCDKLKDSMKKSVFTDTIRISNGENLSSLMNYGFQKFPADFNLIWTNPKLRFMLKFHAAAILYQTAQLCKANKDEIPAYVHMTGNGSKLFRILHDDERRKLVNGIFAAVFDAADVNIQVSDVRNPKFAAAQGCLYGYDSIINTVDDVKRKSFVALGDGELFTLQDKRKLDADAAELKARVRENVVKFVDLFYDLHSGEHLSVDKNFVLSHLEQDTDRDPNINLRDDIRNLFFEYINGLMVGISGQLYNMA